MNLLDVLNKAIKRLEDAGIPEARLDAEYLVAQAAGFPRLKLALHSSAPLSADRERRLDQWVSQRLERTPLAYILEEQPFFNLVLRVTPSVLIPRPETELLVEEALKFLDGRPAATVVDVGTGSGNIALSLAKHPNAKKVCAIDISPAALRVARENALRNAVQRPVQWYLGNLLGPLLEEGATADLIVANLPYVRTDELRDLSPEVRCEPTLALDGGEEGLTYISKVIRQAEDILAPEGCLMLEIGSEQGPAVFKMLQGRDAWDSPRLIRDLAGLPRIIKSQKGSLVGSLND